jgi:hypothetical protein
MPADVRVIAFYLPQFHPIPENDAWWGTGFTEWTNVRRAVPLYAGHNQPREPGELGYYDLRDKAVRYRQVELARQYGVYGFCYYYYWFSGRRLLERPLDLMLADTQLDFPFCVCWANESWSRRWDGSEQDVLLEQKYAPTDPERFIQDLANALQDPRYITVAGSPLLLVYRPAVVPQMAEVLKTWRRTADRLGLPGLHVCGMQTRDYTSGLDDGFDAMVEFPPHSIVVGAITDRIPDVAPEFTGQIFSYGDVVRFCSRRGAGIGLPVYRGLMPRWDNTPRLQLAAHVFDGATPDLYEAWLRRVLHDTRETHEGDRRLVFLNAWNEWAEGAYLEPDARLQYAYLEATARAVFGVPSPAALLATLRQITEGNDEAKAALDQIERALNVKDRIAELIDTQGLATYGLSRDGFRAKFHPIGRSLVDVPARIVADGAVGFVDALNTPDYHRGVTLNRRYDALLQGWIASRHVRADVNSPILLKLTGLESSERYVAQILARVRRDDVVGHLKGQRMFFRLPEEHSLYSGYRAYLNLTAVKPGAYVLDAILPMAAGSTGVMLRLHSSVMVE